MKPTALLSFRVPRTALAALGLGLSGCGSLSAVPEPLAGDLLSAPTTLNIGGQVLRVDTAPRLSESRFSVRVRVAAAPVAAGLPDRTPSPSALPMRALGVYVVTNSGVWKSPRLAPSVTPCPVNLCAWGSSGAGDFEAGEGVQVVTQLQDAQGRVHWLRDAQTQPITVKPARK